MRQNLIDRMRTDIGGWCLAYTQGAEVSLSALHLGPLLVAQVIEEGATLGLNDEVDVRAYEDDPDPDEEYDEDGGFVIKDAEVEAVLETELVLHPAAEITVRNVLPDGAKRTRRAPQRYEPVETPTDDVDRPVKRRKIEPVEDSDEDEEEDEEDEEDDDEEYDEEDEDEESTDSDSEDDDDDPIDILE